jgi:hypothetical protein
VTDDKRSQPPEEHPDAAELRSLVERGRRGDATVLPQLREFLDEHPEVWQKAGDLAHHVQSSWLELLVGDDVLGREAIQLQAEQMRRELRSEQSSTAEELLLDLVVASWLEVQFNQVDQAARKGGGVGGVRRSDSAQRRYLSALKALTTLQKLSTKAFQPPACLRLHGGQDEQRRQA